jgi:hypothetical protein
VYCPHIESRECLVSLVEGCLHLGDVQEKLNSERWNNRCAAGIETDEIKGRKWNEELSAANGLNSPGS